MRLAHLLSVPVLLWALLTGGKAEAEIYRWTDAGGQLHFTERLGKVPIEHREEAIRSAMTPTEPNATSSSIAVPQERKTVRLQRRSDVIQIPFVREGTLMRVDARVNDRVTVPFLVDTGASGVSLPSEVADQLGIRIRPDTPRIRVMTANGAVSRPVVPLESVEVGGARVEGLVATVNPRMDIGLLGGTFFNNFVYRVDAAERMITLVPNDQIRGGMGESAWRQRFDSVRRPLARLQEHLARDVVHRKGELNNLERRRAELETELEELELEANRLDVPHTWRQ